MEGDGDGGDLALEGGRELRHGDAAALDERESGAQGADYATGDVFEQL